MCVNPSHWSIVSLLLLVFFSFLMSFRWPWSWTLGHLSHPLVATCCMLEPLEKTIRCTSCSAARGRRHCCSFTPTCLPLLSRCAFISVIAKTCLAFMDLWGAGFHYSWITRWCFCHHQVNWPLFLARNTSGSLKVEPESSVLYSTAVVFSRVCSTKTVFLVGLQLWIILHIWILFLIKCMIKNVFSILMKVV